MHTIDSQIKNLWKEIQKGTKDSKMSILTERKSTANQEFKVMSFILAGLLAQTHSLVRVHIAIISVSKVLIIR